MSSNEEVQTVSKALLNLGRISSVEGPIRSGFLGFYKAQKIVAAQSEITEDIKYQLTRWQEFCERFIKIAKLEDNKEKLENWLNQKEDGDRIASRTETYVAIFSLFPEKKERQDWKPRMLDLCKHTQAVMDGNARQKDVRFSLSLIEDLQRKVEVELTIDKRMTEKIISGRAPLR